MIIGRGPEGDYQYDAATRAFSGPNGSYTNPRALSRKASEIEWESESWRDFVLKCDCLLDATKQKSKKVLATVLAWVFGLAGAALGVIVGIPLVTRFFASLPEGTYPKLLLAIPVFAGPVIFGAIGIVIGEVLGGLISDAAQARRWPKPPE